MEIDGRLEVILVPEVVGHLLAGLDFRVEALAHRIGYPMAEVGNDIGPMALITQAISRTGASREWVTHQNHSARLRRRLRPQLAQTLLDGPCTSAP